MRKLVSADFRWSGHCWETAAHLAYWGGYQSRGGSYGARDSVNPSDGDVTLVFAPEGRDSRALSETEIALVQWPLSHGPQMQEALLQALVEHYIVLRPKYVRFLGAKFESAMPPVVVGEDFQSLIGIHAIYVHQIQAAGLPYVGFEFGCTWDSEHGLGVLMHGGRVVRLGGVDTAMTLWMAEEDADKN